MSCTGTAASYSFSFTEGDVIIMFGMFIRNFTAFSVSIMFFIACLNWSATLFNISTRHLYNVKIGFMRQSGNC